MRLVGVGGEVRRKWRSDEPIQGDKHENSMKIEYSARLVVPAHEMAFSEGDRGAIMDRQRCGGVRRGAFKEEVRVCYIGNSRMLACYLLSLAGEALQCNATQRFTSYYAIKVATFAHTKL